jgi:hypothetical protein
LPTPLDPLAPTQDLPMLENATGEGNAFPTNAGGIL